jgi:hypothetical protein
MISHASNENMLNKYPNENKYPRGFTRITVLEVKDTEVHDKMTDISFIFDSEPEIDSTKLFSLLSSAIQTHCTKFAYSGHVYDKQGIVYYLATNRGTQEWRNPSHCIALSAAPTTCMGQIEDVLVHEIGQFYPNSSPDSYVTIDFRPSRVAILPDHYTMSYYRGGHGYLLRHWQLLGSNDGETFDVIKAHENDERLTEEAPTQTWEVECGTPYSIFKILITGKDTNGFYFLAISGVEFYGALYEI